MKTQVPEAIPRVLAVATLSLLLAGLPLAQTGDVGTAQTPVASALDADPAVDRIIEIGRRDSRVSEHLRFLTKRIGPRLTGSTNLKRAQEWAVARFKAWGLDARLERWGEVPVGFDRHPWSGGMVAPERIDYTFVTNAWSAGTPGPVRGPAVAHPKSVEEVDELGESLRGAWLVHLPRSELPKKSSVRREILERARSYGIAGEVRRGGDLLITSGRHDLNLDDLPTNVSIRILAEDHRDLLARLEDGQEVELEFDVDNRFFPGPVPQYNVIADLVGIELPDEYVVVGGHLDSWDGAEGAQDNGTGVSTTLEAARLLVEAGARPRRTIRFVLWSGEEQGLLGSRAYVEAHPDLMPRISAVLIHDGGTNYLSGIAGPPALVEDLRRAFEPLLGLDPEMPFRVEENEGLSPGGGSDHSSFVQSGVPGFFWRQSGEADYTFIHHTQHDVLENARPDYQEHSSIVVAVGAYNLARLDGLLDRTNLIRERRPSTRRRMGVFLEDNAITGVSGGSLAEEADWREGDVIVSIDGIAVETRAGIVRELQKGGPRKVFRIRRGNEVIESVLDWTGTPSEVAREKERSQREAEEKAKAKAKE